MTAFSGAADFEVGSTKEFKKCEDIDWKIPPNLPLLKGSFMPLFGKEG
jgi:hypothetical protein